MPSIKTFLKTHSRKIVACMLLGIFLYAAGRLYFELTGGFTVGNITTDITKEPDWEISQPNDPLIKQLLNQPYYYLGKGCQSYVFKSEDGRYVLKFLKFQRFRPQSYLNFFSFIPAVEKIREKKEISKREKLNDLLKSWKIAYEDLKDETGLVYLHLNRSDTFQSPLIFYDKMGLKHELDLNQMMFLVQDTAEMLTKKIKQEMSQGNKQEAKNILQRLIHMLVSEYQRGLGDNDHALMQNTGVRNGVPLHIDVGQFSKENRFKDPDVYHLELFSKTYKFRIWLSKHYPELEIYLTSLLMDIIGPSMHQMRPVFKTVDEGA